MIKHLPTLIPSINVSTTILMHALPYEIVGRRTGDIAECYADVSKAKQDLGWTAKRDLVAMCKDAWQFEKTMNFFRS